MNAEKITSTTTSAAAMTVVVGASVVESIWATIVRHTVAATEQVGLLFSRENDFALRKLDEIKFLFHVEKFFWVKKIVELLNHRDGFSQSLRFEPVDGFVDVNVGARRCFHNLDASRQQRA